MQAALSWMDIFFTVSGHDSLSEESLKVFLDAPHPGDYASMPEQVAVSKLMVWRAIGEFCGWFDAADVVGLEDVALEEWKDGREEEIHQRWHNMPREVHVYSP